MGSGHPKSADTSVTRPHSGPSTYPGRSWQDSEGRGRGVQAEGSGPGPPALHTRALFDVAVTPVTGPVSQVVTGALARVHSGPVCSPPPPLLDPPRESRAVSAVGKGV